MIALTLLTTLTLDAAAAAPSEQGDQFEHVHPTFTAEDYFDRESVVLTWAKQLKTRERLDRTLEKNDYLYNSTRVKGAFPYLLIYYHLENPDLVAHSLEALGGDIGKLEKGYTAELKKFDIPAEHASVSPLTRILTPAYHGYKIAQKKQEEAQKLKRDLTREEQESIERDTLKNLLKTGAILAEKGIPVTKDHLNMLVEVNPENVVELAALLCQRGASTQDGHALKTVMKRGQFELFRKLCQHTNSKPDIELLEFVGNPNEGDRAKIARLYGQMKDFWSSWRGNNPALVEDQPANQDEEG